MRIVPTAEIAPEFHLKAGEFFNIRTEIPGRKVPLKTDGHLRLIFVGVGSAFATRNFQTNLIIIKGDTSVFVDVGTLTTQRLRQFGITPLDMEKVILTHSHADHVGGCEEVALKWRYQKAFMHGAPPGAYKPDLYCPEVYQHILWDRTLRGGLGENEANERLARLQLDDYFHLHVPRYEEGWGRPSYRFTFGQGTKSELTVLLFRTKHVPDSATGWQDSFWSCGLRIDERVLFTGDTRFDPEIIERYGKGCEVIFHDSQSFPGGVHASYDQLKTLSDEVRAKMLLMHLDDGMYRFDPKADGFLGFAEDGLAVVYDFV
jgi:ribonuclease BN (tRNA processing enzyme)